MEALGDLLPRALQKHVTGAPQPVIEILNPLWSRAVGKYISRFSRPAAFENGILTVVVSSPPWAAQIKELTGPICARINNCLGVPVVKRLRVREERPAKLDLPPAVAAESAARARAASEAISAAELGRTLWAESGAELAPDLAEIVERSFVKYFSRAAGRGKE